MKKYVLLLNMLGMAACILLLSLTLAWACTTKTVSEASELPAAKCIVFIGDSITDGNWGGGGAKPSNERNQWDQNHIYGSGFMYLCAAHYQGNYPEQEYTFYNRGISGQTLADLKARWEQDVMDLHPDVLSMLIGTNDVHYYLAAKADGQDSTAFDFAAWEATYRALLTQARQRYPALRIMLGAPFVANTGRMHESTTYPERAAMTEKLASIVQAIAKDFDATFLPFNTLFADLISQYPTTQDTYWIWDGIHPTAAGHQRMAGLWISVF